MAANDDAARCWTRRPMLFTARRKPFSRPRKASRMPLRTVDAPAGYLTSWQGLPASRLYVLSLSPSSLVGLSRAGDDSDLAYLLRLRRGTTCPAPSRLGSGSGAGSSGPSTTKGIQSASSNP